MVWGGGGWRWSLAVHMYLSSSLRHALSSHLFSSSSSCLLFLRIHVYRRVCLGEGVCVSISAYQCISDSLFPPDFTAGQLELNNVISRSVFSTRSQTFNQQSQVFTFGGSQVFALPPCSRPHRSPPLPPTPHHTTPHHRDHQHHTPHHRRHTTQGHNVHTHNTTATETESERKRPRQSRGTSSTAARILGTNISVIRYCRNP